MRQTISFIILGSSGSSVCHFTFSRIFGRLLILMGIGLAIGAGVMVHDYQRLRHGADNRERLQRTLTGQLAEIRHQRVQIQRFAKDFTELKGKLVALSEFEKKVRVIANLENDNDTESLFGVGGSLAEDLDTRIELEESHNGLVREMHQQIEQVNQIAALQNESFEDLLEAMANQLNLLATTPAVRPVKGWVTSAFGHRTSPFTGLKEFHKGIDIANRKGTKVCATADGMVSFAGAKGFLGKVLVLDHGHGMMTRYAHLAEIVKKRGETVKRGDVIATMGDSGRSTGPHLHYEVLLNGVPVNPDKYILN